MSAALEQWGRLDIVVNNAGMISAADPVFESGTVESMDLATWQAALARNLTSAFLVTKAAVPAMTGRGWGRIIMVASVTGPVMAIRSDVGYATAKAGMVGLTRAAAVDTARHGITVNAVAPGWIATGSQTPKSAAKGGPPQLAGAVHPTRSPPQLPGWPAPARPTSPGNTWSSTAATRSPSSAPHQRDPTRRLFRLLLPPAQRSYLPNVPANQQHDQPIQRPAKPGPTASAGHQCGEAIRQQDRPAICALPSARSPFAPTGPGVPRM